jgi:predicted phage terminase large subunit-like protein
MADGSLDADRLIQLLVETARTNFAAFVTATHRPRFKHSEFSRQTCAAVDKFVEDLVAGLRPVLVLTAPPQHGKSSLISRCLPPYLIGRLGKELGTARVALTSYALSRAKANGRDAKNIMLEPMYRAIFPEASLIGFKGDINTADKFSVPKGEVLAAGVGGGMTGFSIDCMLIDDAIKDAVEALSPGNQEKLENWMDSVVTTRLQERSGLVVIGTPWSSNDLLAFVHNKYNGTPNYTRLQFVALNYPDQVGYNPDQAIGALVPELQSEAKLREVQAHMGAQWWAAMYQQAPLGALGAIFGADGVRYYRRADLPLHFTQIVMSVDAAFKDKKSSDYVAAGVWGKTADGRVWLLEMRRERLSFTRTAAAISGLKAAHPRVTKILIEDAANGPALIDQLGRSLPGITGVPPAGSKESRAHAVSWAWENGLVMLPHPDDVPMIKPVVAEIISFPDTRNDDAVDCMVIALQHLCLRDPISAMITKDILRTAAGR